MHTHIIETERLILRPLSLNDAEAEFVWESDPVVFRYLPFGNYTDISDVVKRLQFLLNIDNEHYFGIVRKEDNLLIGECSFGPDMDEPDAWNISYKLRQDCWERGYATEAVRAMIDLARREYGARIIVASHAIANPASGRVMEKCGLTFDHFGEYSRFDGSETFPAKYWRMVLED